MKKTIVFLIFLIFSWTSFAQPDRPDTRAILKTSAGEIVIKLFPESAPQTVDNFIQLARGQKEYKSVRTGKPVIGKPFYNGLTFHKIHPELVIQTGCPWGDGRGWPGYTIEDESRDSMKFDRPFRVAMAKIPGQKNSIGSQFFITTRPLRHMDGQYPIFGEVIAGTDVVYYIGNRRRDAMMRPLKPVVLEEVIIE